MVLMKFIVIGDINQSNLLPLIMLENEYLERESTKY